MDETITINSDEEKFERNIDENDFTDDDNTINNSIKFNVGFDKKRNDPRPKREFIYEAVELNNFKEKEIDRTR